MNNWREAIIPAEEAPLIEEPTPFVWTKAKVHQRLFKDRRISQL